MFVFHSQQNEHQKAYISPDTNYQTMPTQKESFKIDGADLLNKVKELLNEGNIRKITISDKNGKELMSFPLTVGVVGAVFAPVLAAIGALAALIGECTIAIEREIKDGQ